MAPGSRRRTIALVVGLLGGLVGCAGNREGADRNHGGVAERDRDVTIEDEHDESHTVHLEITHEGETIHEQRTEAPPGMDAVVCNFRRSPIAGVARYAVAAELGDGQSGASTSGRRRASATSSCPSTRTGS